MLFYKTNRMIKQEVEIFSQLDFKGGIITVIIFSVFCDLVNGLGQQTCSERVKLNRRVLCLFICLFVLELHCPLREIWVVLPR